MAEAPVEQLAQPRDAGNRTEQPGCSEQPRSLSGLAHDNPAGSIAEQTEPVRRTTRGNGRLVRLIAVPFRALQRIVYPPLCLVCDADIADAGAGFCSACCNEMIDGDVPTCMRCAATVGPYTNTSDGCLQCRRLAHRFDAAVRLGVYTGKLREQCLAFKSSSNELLGRALGRLLVDRRGDALRVARADMVVAVPLHFVRRLRRGFNQAEALARHLADELQLPHRSRILKRVRRTQPQAELKREERLANVRGAFRAKRVPALQGATVLLVDDILTTGATCSEAARALKEAGAARVIVAVVARSQEHAGG